MHTHQVRLRNADVQLHNHRLDHVEKDQAYEINVDLYAETAVDEMLIWTSIDTRMRVNVEAGGYQAVGSTRATAVDLGSFTAGQTKQAVIEVEELLNRDEMRADLMKALADQRAEMKEELQAIYHGMADAYALEIQDRADKVFVPARDGL